MAMMTATTAPMIHFSLPCICSWSFPGSLSVQRQAQREGCSPINGVGHRCGSPVLARDPGDDRQSQPGAVAHTRLVGLPEAVEDVLEGLVVEPGAVVTNDDVGVIVLDVGGYLDGRARGCVADGVGHQI